MNTKKRSLSCLLTMVAIAGCSLSNADTSRVVDSAQPEGASPSEAVQNEAEITPGKQNIEDLEATSQTSGQSASQSEDSNSDASNDSGAAGDTQSETAVSSTSSTAGSSGSSLSPSEIQAIESKEIPESLDDLEIIPGEKFGFVTAQTSRQDLVDAVGEDQLMDEDVHIGEGMMEPATMVNLDDYSFAVVWTDPSRTNALEIREIGPAWRLPGDIGMGTTFTELQSAIGEFEIFGLGWDYGGTLLLENTGLDDYASDMILRLNPTKDSWETHQEDALAVSGDVIFDSTNPHFQPLGMRVTEIIVYLDSNTAQ